MNAPLRLDTCTGAWDGQAFFAVSKENWADRRTRETKRVVNLQQIYRSAVLHRSSVFLLYGVVEHMGELIYRCNGLDSQVHKKDKGMCGIACVVRRERGGTYGSAHVLKAR